LSYNPTREYLIKFWSAVKRNRIGSGPEKPVLKAIPVPNRDL